MQDTGFRGAKLLCAAINQILAHPETWNQKVWHCGTQHCIAGHCEILAGRRPKMLEAGAFCPARDLLGISLDEAFYLCSPVRTLPEIYQVALKMLGRNTRLEVEWDQLTPDLVPFDLSTL